MSRPPRNKSSTGERKEKKTLSVVEQRQILMEVNSMGVNGSKTVMESFFWLKST